jgi:penicillin-binding protein 2
MVWQQEHRLIYEDFLEKYTVVVWCLFALFLILSSRLFYLQVIRGAYYRGLSEQQRIHLILERAPRGDIYDSAGRILVGNKTTFTALFYPFSQSKIPTKELLDQLKKILPVNNISSNIATGWRTGKVVRLSDNLTREEMFKLQEQRLVFPGISVVKESRREYNLPEINSHLVGYLSEVTPEELEDLSDEGFKTGDWIGRAGLEQSYNNYLRGQDGGWQIEVDAYGHQTRLVSHVAPVTGDSVYTAVDSRLQEVAGKGLAESPTGRGAVVVMDSRTGAVKALVSSPGFDPSNSLTNDFGQYVVDKEKKLPLFNRVVQGLYAPGSTFKLITFVAALSEGGVDQDLTFYCPGYFDLGNKRFLCWNKKGHGRLNLIGALANSCNVYFYQLGLKIGPRLIYKYAKEFGLGEKTDIEIAYEKKGLIPDTEWKLKKMNDAWRQGDTVNMAIGQGPLWITPIQMAVYISAVANGGTVYKPYLVEKVVTPGGEKVYQASIVKKGEVNLPENVWRLLHIALEEVVVNGTGRGCYFKNLKVAGKTGTAQNPHGKDHAWFIAYAPADKPEIAMAVIVENGGHGGTAAVPIARKLFETYFNLNEPVKEIPPAEEQPEENND